MAREPGRRGTDATGAAGPEREALATCAWIASHSPFQRKERGYVVCLFCTVAEEVSKDDPKAHAADCLWRRASALSGSSRIPEALAIARDFADQGPWERPIGEGRRVCILCGVPSPSHNETCGYWRLLLGTTLET